MGQTVELLSKMGGSAIFEEEPIIRSIDPGYSVSIPFFFAMDQAATITWTAKAIADDEGVDLGVDLSNNQVIEYTNVIAPKGKGGGGY